MSDLIRVENYRCVNCIHNKPNECLRVDRVTVKPAAPWFVSSPEEGGMICSDFYPKAHMKHAIATWPGFDVYWPAFVDQWLPHRNTDTLVYVTLNDDRSVRYGIPLLTWVFGQPVQDGVLQAVEKMYYRQCRKSPIGYELMREPLNAGVTLDGR